MNDDVQAALQKAMATPAATGANGDAEADEDHEPEQSRQQKAAAFVKKTLADPKFMPGAKDRLYHAAKFSRELHKKPAKKGPAKK